jgi:LmbE family N-acetylglucosaminyl deacetylase
MKFLNYSSVLCLSPHPDDIELSMSGTILNHPGTNFDILTCSYGTKSDKSSSKKRFKEIEDFWERSSCTNVRLFFLSLYLTDYTEDKLISLIEKQGYYKEPEAILIPSNKDTHFEHLLVNRIGLSLGRSKLIDIIEYKSLSTLPEWTPNLFIDISVKNQFKINLLQTIKSQNTKPYFDKETLEAFHSDMQSTKKGISKVEQFKIIYKYA